MTSDLRILKYLAYSLIWSASVATAQEITSQKISRIWKERAESSQSIHVKWSSNYFDFNNPDQNFMFPGELALETSSRSGRLLLTNLPLNVAPMNSNSVPIRGKPQPALIVSDGHRSVGFFPEKPQSPVAFIGKSGDMGESIGPDARVMALRICYRPFDPHMGEFSEKEGFKIEGESEFHGQNCVVVSQGPKTVWVTSDERCLPLRTVCKMAQGDADLSFGEVIIEYAKKPDETWYPASWSMSLIGNDGTTAIIRDDAEVESCIVNGNLDKELFVLTKFPSGTWVTDNIKNTVYIVREGKPDRLVQPGEYNGTNYLQILNSENPMDGKSPSLILQYWPIIVGNLLIGGIAWFLVARGRSRNMETAA